MVAMMGWGIQEQGGWRKGPWTPQEDKLLMEYVHMHGEGRWSSVARGSGTVHIHIFAYFSMQEHAHLGF